MSPELRAKQREFLKRPVRFSTKAWYAVFLLLKNPVIGPVISKSPIYQQKPSMQLFFFRKTPS
jgi:hypothetical protein